VPPSREISRFWKGTVLLVPSSPQSKSYRTRRIGNSGLSGRHRTPPHQTEADGRYRGCDYPGSQTMKNLSEEHEQEAGHKRKHQGGCANHADANRRQASFPRKCIDESSTWDLGDYGSKRASSKRQADLVFLSSEVREVKGDECAKSGLDIGEKEIHPVQALCREMEPCPTASSKPAQTTGLNRRGRISGQRDDSGPWSVKPVELHRLFPPVSAEPKAVPQHAQPYCLGCSNRCPGRRPARPARGDARAEGCVARRCRAARPGPRKGRDHPPEFETTAWLGWQDSNLGRHDGATVPKP
jgi:hypothetical protein